MIIGVDSHKRIVLKKRTLARVAELLKSKSFFLLCTRALKERVIMLIIRNV